VPRDKGAEAEGEKGKDKRQKVTTNMQTIQDDFQGKGKEEHVEQRGERVGGAGAGGGVAKKGGASPSKRARHLLSEEGSGRVPAESSDAAPGESSQASLQAFNRVLNDPMNGAEDEEIEDSVIFRTKQDVSCQEKAMDLARQLRQKLILHMWQPQGGLEDESEAMAFVRNLFDECKLFEKDMSDLLMGSPLSVVLLGNTGDGKSSFANWAIQVRVLLFFFRVMFCTYVLFSNSLFVLQVTEVSEDQYALNKCTGDPLGVVGGPTTRARASVQQNGNLLDWLFKKLEVTMLCIFHAEYDLSLTYYNNCVEINEYDRECVTLRCYTNKKLHVLKFKNPT
jgi:hypothetical protein